MEASVDGKLGTKGMEYIQGKLIGAIKKKVYRIHRQINQ
ncbi:hypothetical protein D082_12870 [Synechocystis sp. PCC 6714]|nr:hypothetical protein D082_12870 [Synechocystis sp. PCC 6714]